MQQQTDPSTRHHRVTLMICFVVINFINLPEVLWALGVVVCPCCPSDFMSLCVQRTLVVTCSLVEINFTLVLVPENLHLMLNVSLLPEGLYVLYVLGASVGCLTCVLTISLLRISKIAGLLASVIWAGASMMVWFIPWIM